MSRVAPRDATVLIVGESGTGKELIACGLHSRGRRRAGPFVPVNCSAVPAGLFEAEFFGFERGAFTDARHAHAGKFEQAQGGTLFLDEVGELPATAQAKLLRVLQDREVTRLGARASIKLDVRILAATNRDLTLAVHAGRFREDLYWRLNVFQIRVPPLRDRPGDLPLLIEALLDRLNRELGLNVTTVSADARHLLTAHGWPGNVRELENVLRSALALCEGPTLTVDDLPPRIRGDRVWPPASATDQPGRGKLADAALMAARAVERRLIQAALVTFRNNRTAAAKDLGINRKTLFSKMRQYGLVPTDESEGP